MSCLRIEPLIDEESKVEEERNTRVTTRTEGKRDEYEKVKNKLRKRSRRKTNKTDEERRIQRWNNNVEEWKINK